jgi:hypothetical protein
MTSENTKPVAVFDYNLIVKEHLVIKELEERIDQVEAELANLRQAYKLAKSQTPNIVAATYHTVGQLVDDYATAAAMPDVALQAMIALQMVIQERRRQIVTEGFDAEHDDTHTNSELARAAVCYAIPTNFYPAGGLWPFETDCFKPTEDKKDIVRAIALLLAELERILRAENITN